MEGLTPVTLCTLLFVLILRPYQCSATYDCAPNEHPVQNTNAKILSQGCVQTGIKTIPGIDDYTYCCDRHNACYRVCGMPKISCDEDFKICLHKLCQSTIGHSQQCESSSETLYLGAITSGLEDYQEFQDKHCMCIETENVHSHYVAALRQFYAIHAPNKSGNIDTALKLYRKRYTTTDMEPAVDFSRLYYDLLSKYAVSAISHTFTRQLVKDYPEPGKPWKQDLKQDL
mmetsp:Transcript_831/g.1404  ORF Transcript_831/g.1404 Transcript_831/m.1404 type:complete len:229 (+) Transcript_831:26-712(+)